MKADGLNVLAMASTGIAAELLHEGSTVHSRICRAKHIDSSTLPNVHRESPFAAMLRNAHVLIIDEISMQHKDVLEFVDRQLRYVEDDPYLRKQPFAGKVINLIFFLVINKICRSLSLVGTGNN